MNMHIAPAAPAPTATTHPTFRSRDVGDRDLIKACKRAHALFKKERSAEQRLFEAEDRGAEDNRERSAWKRASSQLTEAVAAIAEHQARSPEGMAYKAALLSPWVAAGFGLDDERGPGRDLALSIAQDARIIGMRDIVYRAPRAAKS